MNKQTKKQKRNEYFAKFCDEIAEGKSKHGKYLRDINRRIDKRKGKSKFNLDKKEMKEKKDKTYTFFTVGELKRLLKNIDDNLPIGVVGPIGDFIPVYESGFYIGQANLIPDGKTWREMNNHKSDVFLIPKMDIVDPEVILKMIEDEDSISEKIK